MYGTNNLDCQYTTCTIHLLECAICTGHIGASLRCTQGDLLDRRELNKLPSIERASAAYISHSAALQSILAPQHENKMQASNRAELAPHQRVLLTFNTNNSVSAKSSSQSSIPQTHCQILLEHFKKVLVISSQTC